MVQTLALGSITVDVVWKDIKNLHLSVHPPTGRVRIAAPRDLPIDIVRAYAISKVGWIKRNQKRLVTQSREVPRDYTERESHFVWGERLLLKVRHADRHQGVHREHTQLILTVRSDASHFERHALVEAWYREELRVAAIPALTHWQDRLAVTANSLFIQRMKTKWGSCNPVTGNIRLNTELAKKPRECLDYVLLHELAHLIERNHSHVFHEILDHSMPHWKDIQRLLNSLPLSTPA
jgi:predicted metal-dependent hydrolase